MKKILGLMLLGVASVMGSGSINAQLALIDVDPAPGETAYDYNTYWDIQVFFDGSVSFDSAEISYGDITETLAKDVYANIIRMNDCIQLVVSNPSYPENFVKQAVNSGATSFTLTIKGVESDGTALAENKTGNESIVVDNGTVTITYKLEHPAVYLEDESDWPVTFYQYWEAGDESAIATLVFSQPIKDVYEASVVMAEVNPGGTAGGDDLNSYTLTPVIKDNKVILDFSGVKRFGSSNKVTVVVTGVRGENGLPAEMSDGLSIFHHMPYLAQEAPSGPNNGVETILQENLQGKTVYNLKGEKVNQSAINKGIYIIDGKKTMVK